MPASLAAAQYLPVLGEIFKEALAEDRDATWFRMQLTSRLPIIEGVDQPLVDNVLELFNKMQDLHKAGRDGLWWQLITNAFAPALQLRFDYLVGNPPWVSWDTLPSSYRRDNDDLWLLYGLRPDAPPDRRQASTNVQMDIAMLFVAVCIDRYLRESGSLGFVITASVFRSELAGRGFRRRRLSSNGSYEFVHLDDMSELRVFDGAQNQTAVLVARNRPESRGQLLPVTHWSGSETNSIPTDADLRTVATMTVRRNLYAEPCDPRDVASPLLIMPRIGLQASRFLRRRSPYVECIRKGVDTRGANGVYFLEVLDDMGDELLVQNLPAAGRNRRVPQIRAVIEKDATRWLVRGASVSRGCAKRSGAILFFHSDEHMSFPITPTEARTHFPPCF